jgi:hypothetical protein
MRLWLLIFLGTLTMVRRAQRNTHLIASATSVTATTTVGASSVTNKLSESPNPSAVLGIFPHEEHGVTTLRDSVEEGNMQRVVAILQSNIKQWSFIEAQLLEPNVNLGMVSLALSLSLSLCTSCFS